jgi:Threonine dehydrogenase and related Zn-dependent dehydrogenases
MRYRKVLALFPYCTGGFSDFYYLMPGHFVFKVQDDLPEEMLTPVNCALAQVAYGLQRGGAGFGDTVVVQGAGGLGLYACAVAKEMGATRVIAIDGVPPRLELALQCGADEVIDLGEHTTPEARVERVRQLTEGRRADVVIEVVGVPGAIPEGLRMVRRGGTYVEIGNISQGSDVTVDASELIKAGVQWVSTLHYHPRVLPACLDFLVQARGRYALDRIVSHQYPLERISDAFQEAEWYGRQREAGVTRAIITMDG